jgi:Tfp pilus assembly ATPase PilU
VARLDKLIQVMQEQRAEALQLAVGKPASLMQNGSARPITREALSDV